MKLPIFQIDAFTSHSFGGNPAAVIPLSDWLAEDVLQAIAEENNLSETAYVVGGNGHYELRWFTPAVEVDLCGHATVAAAWVIRNELNDLSDLICFESRSGELQVRFNGTQVELNFPAQPGEACATDILFEQAFGIVPEGVMASADYMVLFENQQQIEALQPDFSVLKQLDRRGVICTAPGDQVDFVSRWFGPNVGVDEDPVTGSAHCALTPYWAERLGKSCLSARQLSARGGELECEINGDRVLIRGNAVKYMQGQIEFTDT